MKYLPSVHSDEHEHEHRLPSIEFVLVKAAAAEVGCVWRDVHSPNK